MFEALVALPAIGLMLLFVELALGVIATRAVARLALVPIGSPVEVPLPKVPMRQEGPGYREGAGTTEHAGLDDRWRVVGVHGPGALLQGLPRILSFVFPAVLRVDGRVIDGVLALRTRMTVPCLPTLAAGLTAAGILIASAGAWWAVIPVTFAVLLGAAQHTFFAAMIRLDAARRLREAIAETQRSS